MFFNSYRRKEGHLLEFDLDKMVGWRRKHNPDRHPIISMDKPADGHMLRGLAYAIIIILGLALLYIFTGIDLVQWVANQLREWGIAAI